jgi:hypothetical protein
MVPEALIALADPAVELPASDEMVVDDEAEAVSEPPAQARGIAMAAAAMATRTTSAAIHRRKKGP